MQTLWIFVSLLLPQCVYGSCCRLPFTDSECQVYRTGPHRYQIMPDRVSGIVTESTECRINDFDASYRKVADAKSACNDCPGLLILHTNSSEIFLFPEYLERILEGRTDVQRKNIIILTTSLVGEYDLNFALLSRYYASRPIDRVPSIYVDLQLPPFDAKRQIQPSLRLRLPSYQYDEKDYFRVSRQLLLNPINAMEYVMTHLHELPNLYHFDFTRHHPPPDQYTVYDIQLSATYLVFTTVETTTMPRHGYMASFGENPCLATGFTRLFCPIEKNIKSTDHLTLSELRPSLNRVEHLTIAVTGDSHVLMSLSNHQMKPAEQVKILLLRGHLSVTDINANLPTRVEYGLDCKKVGLVVLDGFSTTLYRRFDTENVMLHKGNNVMTLPSCFSVLRNTVQAPLRITTSTHVSFIANSEEIVQSLPMKHVPIETEAQTIQPLMTSEHNNQTIFSSLWQRGLLNKKLASVVLLSLISLTVIPTCLCIFYCVYWKHNRQQSWTLKHSDHINAAYDHSSEDESNVSTRSYVNNSTQTTDATLRI